MNTNGCQATQTLDRFVHKSNKALLLTQRVYSVSATINYTYLRSETAAQKKKQRMRKIKQCEQHDVFITSRFSSFYVE